MTRTRIGLLLAATHLSLLALACGSSGGGDEPPPAPAHTPASIDDAFWTELCGVVPARVPSRLGERVPAWEAYRELDGEAARARACSPGRSWMDAASGLYRMALLAAEAHDDATFVRYIRQAALDLADPVSIAKLAQIEYQGIGPTDEEPSSPVLVARDRGLAYAHIRASHELAEAERRATGDNRLLTMVVGATLGRFDWYGTPAGRAEYDPEANATEVQTRVTEIIARFELVHGALPAR